MSPTKQFFTGDWLEDVPIWDSDFQKAYEFPSQEVGLEHMRKHINDDIEAKRSPGFLGARIICLDVRDILMKQLVKEGYSVERKGETIWITFDPIEITLAKARATYPHERYGVKLLLRSTRGVPYKW